MLWLGRWKLALIYALAGAAAIMVPIVFARSGVIRPISPLGLDDFELLSELAFGIGIVGIVHAFRLNATAQPRPFYSKWYIALPLPTLILLGIALFLRTYLYQPFSIPSASGIPNQLVGDYVFVSKLAYGNGGEPQAGDVAMIKFPGDPRITYFKRVVGLPGDKIQMVNGVLNINGAAVKMEEVKLPPLVTRNGELVYEGIRKFYRETLPNGRSYVIADMGDTPQDNTNIYVVPEGHYFLMGDNRDNTQDSRFLDKVGYVPRENFIGTVVSLFWNGQGLPIAGRPDETYPTK